MTVVTGHNTSYTIVINDTTKFKSFGTDNLTGSNFTSFSNYYYDNYLHNSGPLVGLNEIAARELAMLTALENPGLSLLRGNSEYDKWQKIEAQNNNTKNVDCN